ncbi:hypothetical protein SCOR_10215 [Sulfidibacter corallicola]
MLSKDLTHLDECVIALMTFVPGLFHRGSLQKESCKWRPGQPGHLRP